MLLRAENRTTCDITYREGQEYFFFTNTSWRFSNCNALPTEYGVPVGGRAPSSLAWLFALLTSTTLAIVVFAIRTLRRRRTRA